MQNLYPIVRRVRRPLIQENAETLKAEMLKAEKAEPVKAVVELGNIQQPTSNIEHPTEAAGEIRPASGQSEVNDEKTSTQADGR